MKRWWLVLAVAACGDNSLLPDAHPPIDQPPPVDLGPDANPLEHVQGTGLCDDPGCLTINADIHEYEPRAGFTLFADGATKRRWIQLPAGSKIDTTDMDHWVFPVGTKIWKEFASNGTRVETRFMNKVEADDEAPNAWFFISYVWNATQDDTTPTTTGATNANGTQHDVPSRADCRECHNNVKPSRVLGFAALALDYDAAAPLMDLEDLIDGNLLTAPPTTNVAHDRFKFGTLGNGSGAVAGMKHRAALAYMHANCGHCHNPTSQVVGQTPIEMRLEVGKLGSIAATPAFKTLVFHTTDPCDVNSTDDDSDGFGDNGCARISFFDDSTGTNINYDKLIVPQDEATSGLLIRTQLIMTNKKMPRLGTETMDPAGQTALKDWIGVLTP